MTIALIAVGTLVAVSVAFEVVLRFLARRARSRFDNLPPSAQCKYQESLHKAQALDG